MINNNEAVFNSKCYQGLHQENVPKKDNRKSKAKSNEVNTK